MRLGLRRFPDLQGLDRISDGLNVYRALPATEQARTGPGRAIPTRSCRLSSAFEEFEEVGLVEDGDVELAGLVQFAACFFAGDDVICFL